MKTIPIGEVSQGTLRHEDLAAALLPLTREFLPAYSVRLLESIGLNAGKEGPEWDISRGEIINTVIDQLGDHVPEFCTFSFAEGDGASLGCWPSPELAERAIMDGDAIRIQDLGDLDHIHTLELVVGNPDIGHAVLVNDHGNMSLYALERTIKATSIWETV